MGLVIGEVSTALSRIGGGGRGMSGMKEGCGNVLGSMCGRHRQRCSTTDLNNGWRCEGANLAGMGEGAEGMQGA